MAWNNLIVRMNGIHSKPRSSFGGCGRQVVVPREVSWKGGSDLQQSVAWCRVVKSTERIQSYQRRSHVIGQVPHDGSQLSARGWRSVEQSRETKTLADRRKMMATARRGMGLRKIGRKFG